jgi:hypothetical protein
VIKVFVSYSRDDESLVAPIVRLLRVNTVYVFQDVDGVRPGKRWREEIARGIAESNLVVVFWCRHELTSASVSEEWTAAIEQKKDLLPLLLDGTPLPKPLSEFQYIDFRATVGDNHGPEAQTAEAMPSTPAQAPAVRCDLPAHAPKSSMRPFAWGSIGAVLLVAVALLIVWPVRQEPAFEPVPMPAPVDTVPAPTQPSQAPPIDVKPLPMPAPSPSPPPPSPASEDAWSPSAILALLVGIALAVAAVWRLLRKRKPPPDLAPRPSSRWEHTGAGIERRMASEIEAEIARRTSG